MIRILHAVDGMSVGGGIQTFIMNVYRNINREEIQFDFLLHRHNENSYEDEIRTLGGRIYYTPGRKEGYSKNRKGLNDFFRAHKEYRIVHFHASSLSYLEPLIIAKKYGIKTRVIHSHSSRVIGKKKYIHLALHKINQLRIDKIATHHLACGDVAAKWMYGNVIKEPQIITNGIKTSDFIINLENRKKMREELGIRDDSFLLCHIGRFEPVKNHQFILNIFKALLKLNENSVLLLVGNGTVFEDTINKAKEMKIDNKVLFLGIRNDVNLIYQMSDAFILPSLYEGFPVSAIEAQAAGIPTFLSDTITSEALIKRNAIQISLNLSSEEWAKKILSNRENCPDNTILLERGLDIEETIKKLKIIYGLTM